MSRSVFFSSVKKSVTIFKISVTDQYEVILNPTSKTCKNEPFSSKTRPWYEIEFETFLEELNDSLNEKLFDIEIKIYRKNFNERFLVFSGWTKSSKLTLNRFYQEKKSFKKTSKHWVDSEKNVLHKKMTA